MKRLPLTLVSIVLLALFAATAAVPETEVRQEPLTWQQAAESDGAVLFVEACGACHGADAKGNGPASPALAAPAPDLTQLALYNDGVFPAEEVQEAITGRQRAPAHGSLEMPVWGKVFEDVRPDRKPGARWGFARLKILALTEYLESIQVEEEAG